MEKNIDVNFILQHFDKFGIKELPQEAFDDFISRLRVVSKKKHEMILKEGEVCNDFTIVKSGLLRMYHYKKKKDISDMFLSVGCYCVDVDSFSKNEPSKRAIEVLEPAELYLLTRDDLSDLSSKYLEFNLFTQKLIARVISGFQWKAKMLLFATAEERFEIILKQVPNLMQRVSSVNVATYLGVTPETLSRIRGKMVHEEKND